jgi:hypothetical protein
MKERPILFSAPMIRAILEDRKGVTRRVVVPAVVNKHGELEPGPEVFGAYDIDGEWGTRCPYGQPGIRLWVREGFALERKYDGMSPTAAYEHAERRGLLPMKVWRQATDADTPGVGKRRPSIHMPRWASRILLDVTDMRVERLQEIDHVDAEREGVEPDEPGFSAVPPFARLWNEINARRGYSWEKNPWVWRIAFRKAQTS